MIHTTLACLTCDELRDAFNRVYMGYIMPAQFTTESITAHVTSYASVSRLA